MENHGIGKTCLVCLICLFLWVTYFIAPVHATESESLMFEESVEQTESFEKETVKDSESYLETQLETQLETEAESITDVVFRTFEDTKGKKELTVNAIENVLGYYSNFLSYEDVVKIANAGYDVSGFTESSFIEEISSLPMVFSIPQNHDTTHVGQAAVSFSKADTDKLYLYGSNSYYKNGTYTRVYATKKRMTIGADLYIGYCFEPSGTDPLADTVLDCYRLNNCPEIIKALYYGYGGPEFETGGLKNVLDGINSGNSYFYSGGRENCYEVLTHCLIGKLYGDAAWAMGLSQESADAVVRMESMLNGLDGPVEPKICLERYDGKPVENETTYMENGYQRTTTLMVVGDSRNTIKLSLPQNVEAVDGGGNVYSGSFSFNGGTAFYLRAPLDYNSVYKSGDIKGNSLIHYVVYMIFGGEGTRQDCGTLFRETYSGSTAMSVTFKSSQGKLMLKKTSANTEITNDNVNYSLEGAEYGVYRDSACSKKIGSFKTTKNGVSNTLTVDAGTYYVKELKAPKGYEIDTTIHKAVVSGGKTTTLTLTEKPITGQIIIKKESSDSVLVMNNEAYSNLTAKFEIYNEFNVCIGTIVTNSKGEGMLSDVPLGVYHIKEVEAPKGYALDETVQNIQITSEEIKVERRIVNEPKYVKIALTKEIRVNDIHFDHGNPMFIFKVKGTDREGELKEMYRIVDFTPEYVEQNADGQGNVQMTVVFDQLYAGEYTAEEMETSRYTLENIKQMKNGECQNNIVKFVLDTETANEGKATFVNRKYEQQNYSDTSKVINELNLE